jgi:hypothetical protein
MNRPIPKHRRPLFTQNDIPKEEQDPEEDDGGQLVPEPVKKPNPHNHSADALELI